MPPKPGKKFPWIIYLLALVLILAFMFAPIGSVVACGWIANAHGCKVDEGSVHPCIINGVDRGELLYQLGVLGWLMLVTLPVGAFAIAGWLVTLILHRSRWRKKRVPSIGLILLANVKAALLSRKESLSIRQTQITYEKDRILVERFLCSFIHRNRGAEERARAARDRRIGFDGTTCHGLAGGLEVDGCAARDYRPAPRWRCLSGDPNKKGDFTVRAQLPAGYKVPPHTHPTAEHITVISGSFQRRGGGEV